MAIPLLITLKEEQGEINDSSKMVLQTSILSQAEVGQIDVSQMNELNIFFLHFTKTSRVLEDLLEHILLRLNVEKNEERHLFLVERTMRQQ